MPERKVGSANNSRGAAGVRKRQASVRHGACIDLAGYPSQDCASAGDLMIITATAPIAGTEASRRGSISGPGRAVRAPATLEHIGRIHASHCIVSVYTAA